MVVFVVFTESDMLMSVAYAGSVVVMLQLSRKSKCMSMRRIARNDVVVMRFCGGWGSIVWSYDGMRVGCNWVGVASKMGESIGCW